MYCIRRYTNFWAVLAYWINVRVCLLPCPDPGNIRHYWWSSGQDLCFRCRGSPVVRVRTPVGAKAKVMPESPLKWWPRRYNHTSHTLQGLLFNSLYCTSAPTPHCSVFLSALLHTPLKHLTHEPHAQQLQCLGGTKWRKPLPRSQKFKAPLVVQWSRPLHPVQRFPAARVQNPGWGRR